MTTIVEADQHISVLWGDFKNRDSEAFRLMRYVMRVDYEKVVLLHNAVTGHLIVLDDAEAEMLETLPKPYSPEMEELVRDRFLVPEGFDEHRQVANMRKILWKLEDAQRESGIVRYTILPTTGCNARCYYCFEQGVKRVTMTEQTARDVIEFIAAHHNGKPIIISWFGGEPTTATKRIDQICEGLREKGIDYRSEMTTNGYLFDEAMVEKAEMLWNLKSLMICIDGVESNYNRIKSYIYTDVSPYQRVMRNIELLTSRGIYVDLRMNFDLNNYKDFPELLKDVECRFKGNANLRFRTHPVNGEYTDASGCVLHGDSDWFSAKVYEFNSAIRKAGLLRKSRKLPILKYGGCEASNDAAVVITAEGMLVRCPEQFGDDQITGNVRDGITNPQQVLSWKEFIEYSKCVNCVLYPRCNRIKNCSVKDLCNYFLELKKVAEDSIKQHYKEWSISARG